MVPHGLLSESVEEEREEELEELSVAHASTLREMLAYQEDKHEEHMELIREHYEDQVRKVEQSYRMALDEEAQRIARSSHFYSFVPYLPLICR
jgi:Mg/Co/Ni transporter MgtE